MLELYQDFKRRKEKMKKRVLLGMAIISCIAASSCFAQGTTMPKSENNLKQQEEVKTIFSFKKEIGLTDEQESKIKALLYDQQSLINSNRNRLTTLGTELDQMMNKKQDLQLIKSKIEEISKIQVEITYQDIVTGRKIEDILSPAQLEKWKNIKEKFSAQTKNSFKRI